MSWDIEDEVGPIHDGNRKYLLELFNQAGAMLDPPALKVPVIFGTGGEIYEEQQEGDGGDD